MFIDFFYLTKDKIFFDIILENTFLNYWSQ